MAVRARASLARRPMSPRSLSRPASRACWAFSSPRLRAAATARLWTRVRAAPAASPGRTPTHPPSTTTTSESTTTTVPLTKDAIVLAPDGLGAQLPFGQNAARSINLLIQALGPAEKNTPLPVAQACGATRRLQWGSFQALVNEVGAT